jgi:hypothetical protein
MYNTIVPRMHAQALHASAVSLLPRQNTHI